MRIAIIGCGHGLLDNIYASVLQSEIDTGLTVDCVFICGDFQAIRNEADLDNMAVPLKYRTMGDFHKYYSEQVIAPYLTVFVGGNHESSAYLWELYHGGWVAKNIYFLGWANVIKINGLTVAGISGIYDWKDYTRGHFETAPYSSSHIKSIYHTRQHEVMQLSLYENPIDIFISHDWPRNIAYKGNLVKLLKEKPFFKQDINSGRLGSPALEHLMHQLRPRYWFSGHLHVQFAAVVPNTPPNPNPDIANFKHLPAPTATVSEDEPLQSTTRFLALDKALPGRYFLQFVDIETPEQQSPPTLAYDIDWLAIVKATHHKFPVHSHNAPTQYLWDELREAVHHAKEDVLDKQVPLAIPESHSAFTVTSPLHIGGPIHNLHHLANQIHSNPQTKLFTKMLGIPLLTAPAGKSVIWEDYLNAANNDPASS